MRSTAAACAQAVAALSEAGLLAATDPEELTPNPVCVWVTPREIRDRRLDGGATLVAWLYVIGGNVATDAAMTLLDDALAGVLDLFDVAGSDDVIDLAAALTLPSGSNLLPAYRVAIDLDL
jgi:hypothetical protein